ncbi:MAG: hypothetical protein CVV61_06255 [Tenericutes bacterium HGW-Tenericutes-6]|nr:MAG: hypothetical protein CVV61_06255 [Tenericutes bacterium HGW-Tenericutes-6]
MKKNKEAKDLESLIEQPETLDEASKPSKDKHKKKEKVVQEAEENTEKELTKKELKQLEKARIKAEKDEEKRLKNRAKWTQKYFKKFSGRHQDNYDDMLDEDYQNVIKRAKELSSIGQKDYTELVLITVPDAFEKHGKVNYRMDKKEDGTFSLLYDQALVTSLFFGEEQLFYHQANVDHRNGHIGFDVAGEFNYFDVVHMETAIKYDNNDHPKYITLDLEVGLSDGTIVPFHLRNHRIHSDYDLEALLTPTEAKILNTLKQKVRASKKS